MYDDNIYDKTLTFSLGSDNEPNIKNNLTLIYDALLENGYNPINQIAGYIISGDPTYITTHNNARNIIQKLDRYELLKILIKFYLSN